MFDNSNDIHSFYKSLNIGHKELEMEVIDAAINNNLVPMSLRFSTLANKAINEQIVRGVIKTKDELYYFHKPLGKEVRLIKAVNNDQIQEAERLYKSCQLGCDIIKADKEIPDEDKEDEKKAGPGEGRSGNPAILPESVAVPQTVAGLTDVHPGATSAYTPDHNEAKWHGKSKQDSLDLLKAFNDQLDGVAKPVWQQYGNKEKEFFRNVLGKTPEEIEQNRVYMSPTQRAQFNVWLTRSLTSNMKGLKKFINKRTK